MKTKPQAIFKPTIFSGKDQQYSSLPGEAFGETVSPQHTKISGGIEKLKTMRDTIKTVKSKWKTLKVSMNIKKVRAEPFISVKKLIVASWHTPHEKPYGAVLVSKLKSHFIVLVLHFMLYFSNLMQHQLHFHALLRIDSENSFYEGTMV